MEDYNPPEEVESRNKPWLEDTRSERMEVRTIGVNEKTSDMWSNTGELPSTVWKEGNVFSNAGWDSVPSQDHQERPEGFSIEWTTPEAMD